MLRVIIVTWKFCIYIYLCLVVCSLSVTSLCMASDGLLMSKDIDNHKKVWDLSLQSGKEIFDNDSSESESGMLWIVVSIIYNVVIILMHQIHCNLSINFSVNQRLVVSDLRKGSIRLSCKSGQITFNGVIGRFEDVSLVWPIKVDGIDQLLVVVSDPSRHNLIALQTQFKL